MNMFDIAIYPMKIVYLGNFENPFSDATEKHIAFALEQMGHEVVRINEKDYKIPDVLAHKGDLFLFHKGGTSTGSELPKLIELLNKITYKKVFWYFDKVYNHDRIIWMETVIPFVDHGFLTDETYIRRNNYRNISVLRQGVGDANARLGEFKERYQNDIVFLGSVYGDRDRFTNALEKVYGKRFTIINGIFGSKLNDLCASTKVFVAPIYPQDNFYWSSRVYQILGAGGFLIHPRFEGLKEEFTKEELVTYVDGGDLKEKIDYYLDPAHEEERERIRLAGHKKVIEQYKYSDRVRAMMETLYGRAD